MKKAVLIAGILLMNVGLFAQERYSLSLQGVFDHNNTYNNRGGLDIAAYMPVNRNFESEAGLELLSPGIFGGTAVARPKFPLKVGELFLEGAVHMRAYNSSRTGNFTMAASFGYRMDYVSVQLGMESLNFLALNKKMGEEKDVISEPVNLLYKLVVNARPASSPWNISFGFGNFTLFQYERPYSPIISFSGRYDVIERLSVLGEIAFKPSGMFNMTTRFDGLTVRIGTKYRF